MKRIRRTYNYKSLLWSSPLVTVWNPPLSGLGKAVSWGGPTSSSSPWQGGIHGSASWGEFEGEEHQMGAERVRAAVEAVLRALGVEFI